MISRTQTKGYKEGARLLQNMVALAQGPAERRQGFTFIFEALEVSPTARLIIFPVSADDYYLFLFTDLKLYIFDKVGQPIAPERVLNSQFHSGAANWISNPGSGATITFTLVTCTLVSSPSRTAVIQQNVTGLQIGVLHRLRIIQLSPLDTIRLRVGTTQGGNQVAEVTAATSVITLNFTPTATSHWIEVASMVQAATAVIESVSVQEVVAVAAIPSIYPADVLGLLQYDFIPDGSAMYITSGSYPVQSFVHNGGGSFTISNAVFISPPTEWTGSNHPRSLSFFQGRLFFGGTGTTPSTFWGSKSGDYLNFTLGTLADDAIKYTIAKRGAIRWILGAKNLLIGTENGEFVVSAPAGSQELITPDNINLEPQSSYGSIAAQPTVIGNLVLYYAADGKKLYSMGYRFEESGWVSADLAFIAEHITQNRVVRQAHVQSPDSIIWAIDTTGKLIGCSYDRPNNVIGWHGHPVAQISFTSLASVRFLGTDLLWATWRVTRGVDTLTQVGVMNTTKPGLYLDAAKRVTVGVATNTFSGFQHLAGLTVGVLADGGTHPDVVVSAGGVITLTRTALSCLAGMKSTARLTTLPFEPGVTPQGSQTSMFRFNQAYVRVTDSAIPLINGKRGAERHPLTPMDTPETPRSGKLFVVTLGYSDEAEIDVQEPQPLPLTVAGIYGDLAVEQL